ncbi:hypothetical protein [Streptomyces sp. NPDC058394]|uniref:hypothetical protein n=1 Tax=Streptomyces sp. NPDC058394 TaxID=3346477 RepID=UPI00365E14D2
MPSTAATAPAPATSSVGLQETEKRAVFAAFDAMWAERTKAYAKGTRLEKYATLDAAGRTDAGAATGHASSAGTGPATVRRLFAQVRAVTAADTSPHIGGEARFLIRRLV